MPVMPRTRPGYTSSEYGLPFVLAPVFSVMLEKSSSGKFVAIERCRKIPWSFKDTLLRDSIALASSGNATVPDEKERTACSSQ